MDWPIQDVVRLSGTTSRTLRHYGQLGLVRPSRVGAGGVRYYDQAAIRRLQRVLLLRDLGVSLPEIARVLEGHTDDAEALRTHAEWLEQERGRIDRQLAAVRATITALQEGTTMSAHEMLDGFDHTQYRDEVAERWGTEARDRSEAWWEGLTMADKERFGAESKRLIEAWKAAFDRGVTPDSDEAQDLAAQQWQWITVAWGGREPTAEAFIGLGEMYVADERFGVTYSTATPGGPEFVRDAMRIYAERTLAG